MTEDFTRVSGHAAVLRRRGWIIVLAALLGGILGALAAPLATTTFTAEAVVLVPVPEEATDTTVVDTQVEIATSDQVIQDVVDELGGSADPESVLSSLGVEVVAETSAISISSTQEDPDTAAEVANAVAGSYVDFSASAAEGQRQDSIDALEQQLEATSRRLIVLRQELAGLAGPDQAEAQAAVARQQQRQTRLVDLLAESQDPTTAPDAATVLKQAVPPDAASGGRIRAGFFGLVLGLLVGLVVAYARHFADDRIHDEDELVALVGRTPILGRIPRSGTGRREGGVLSDPSSKTAEAFRALAVNLRLRIEHPRHARGSSARKGSPDVTAAGSVAQDDSSGVLTLVISASPGEGKSSVAGDLALTAAGMGLKVTVVDADLRNPQLAPRFEVANSPGLTDALKPGAARAPRPVDSGVANLRLLPAGSMDTDPVTLLGRTNPTTVWDTLRAESDLVVVDTAPVLYAAETLELATVADRVVLIVERGRTTRRDVRTVIERLSLVGAAPAGVVLTKVPADAVVGGYYPRQD